MTPPLPLIHWTVIGPNDDSASSSLIHWTVIGPNDDSAPSSDSLDCDWTQ